MKVVPADPDRPYDLPGIPGGARRPVDLDASNTGFTNLRSVRVYSFQEGSIVDGHAEEDEVFVVVIKGHVEMKIGWEDSTPDAAGVYTLGRSANGTHLVAAYLPPRSVYQLTPHSAADVLYARATPLGGRAPAVFAATTAQEGTGLQSVLLERTYAERLSLSVERWEMGPEAGCIDLPNVGGGREAVVHLQGSPADRIANVVTEEGGSRQLRSWDTMVFQPDERATLQPQAGASLLVVTVSAA